MIELGKRQELEVLREKEFGVYLGEKERPEHRCCSPESRFRRERKSVTGLRYLSIKIQKTA